MRHYTLLYIAAALALAACKGERQQEDLAARAAGEYYGHLVAGRYDEYLGGVADAESLPPSYRTGLIDAAKQTMAAQKAEHGGIDSVTVVGSRRDSLTGQTVALLTLCYSDSLREEVAVPMVEREGKWLME